MIEFNELRKSFGEREILKGLSLKINEGEILFILGTSGTGKSVLLKLLVGLLQASSGNIKIDNEDVTHFTEEEFLPVRQKCGMVFQQPALFDSLSVFENVAFGLRRHHPDMPEEQVQERVRKCLRLVQLKGVEEKLPSKFLMECKNVQALQEQLL